VVGVAKASYSGHAGEANIHNPAENFREGLEENTDPEGGGRIVARLARFVQNNAVSFFQGAGVIALREKRSEEVLQIMSAATLLTRFQTELGVLSGPGADVGDEPANALSSSDASSAGTSLKGKRMVWGSSTGLRGKK